MCHMSSARALISSWNPQVSHHLKRVRLEEDIRDALQSVRTTQPSTEQRNHLLELSDRVGVQYALLGFPASSDQEMARCQALAVHAKHKNLRIEPVFMARAVESDVASILAIREKSHLKIAADIFIGISALRLAAENWSLSEVLAKLEKACSFAHKEGLPFRVSYEDSTRASPEAVKHGLRAASGFGASAVVLCDTSGDCVPEGASRHTTFAVNELAKYSSATEIGWHGHNDKGLSLANAWAAAQSGANFISGTFLGIGERTGNTPLEQMILLLTDAGSSLYDQGQLSLLCERFAVDAGISISPNAPLVGSDAFSTSTGTHVAAIVKARLLGEDYEDLMYSSVSARALGRKQSLLIGPGSGRAAVAATLQTYGRAPQFQLVEALLDHCKQSSRCLEGHADIIAALEALSPQSTQEEGKIE